MTISNDIGTTYSEGLSESLTQRLRLPAYSTKQTAQLCEITSQTVSRWFHSYHPVFGFDPKERRARLSYLQLIETAVVARFRRFGLSLQKIRVAHEYLQNQFKAEYPFAQLKLKTDGAHIIKDLDETEIHQKQLIVADENGQTVWATIIEDRLHQFDYDFNLAIRWHPIGRDSRVIIDPQLSFGASTVADKGIATWAIMERVRIGETSEEIADDFDLEVEDVEAVMRFEDQLAAA